MIILAQMEDFFAGIYFVLLDGLRDVYPRCFTNVATFEELLWRSCNLHIFHLLDSERRSLNLNVADIL